MDVTKAELDMLVLAQIVLMRSSHEALHITTLRVMLELRHAMYPPTLS